MNFFNARYIQSAVAFLLSLFLSFLTVLQWPLKVASKYMMLLFLNGFLPVGIRSKRAVVDKRSLG